MKISYNFYTIQRDTIYEQTDVLARLNAMQIAFAPIPLSGYSAQRVGRATARKSQIFELWALNSSRFCT